MSIEENKNEIEKLIDKIQKNDSMYPAKKKFVMFHLREAKEANSRPDEKYIEKEKIDKIERAITIIFIPIFFIFLMIYSYGIPNIVSPLDSLSFYIAIASFTMAMFNHMISANLFMIYQKFSKPKSS